jgi:beta-galactosidase
VGISAGQGILTRPFISGGWVWTGFDYKGEPTPYRWPNINSHFGIIDMAGFPKDRFYWYKAWFTEPSPPELYLFPHWNWDASFNLPIWVFSNADEVELFVNGVSQGRKAMPQYAHIEWTGVRWASGNIRAVAYSKGSNVVRAETWRNTTGVATGLRISIKDGFGGALVAGCSDVALVQVEVVDASGALVPVASNTVTFTVSGPGSIAGTGNGDPSSHVSDKSPTRPAYHGRVLAVVAGGTVAGNIVVGASSPGFQSVSLTIPQAQPTSSFSAAWCHNGPSM